MFYCAKTAYRRTVLASGRSYSVRHRVRLDGLKDEILVHPSVVAVRPTESDTDAVHPEYGEKGIAIGPYSPIAYDKTWRVPVNTVRRSVDSIFQFKPREDIRNGEFDVEIDVAERYVHIVANKVMKSRLDRWRHGGQAELVKASLCTSALLLALTRLRKDGEDEEAPADEPPDGWAACVRRILKEKRLSLDQNSLLLVAQRLLDAPFDAALPSLDDWASTEASE